ncbi:MAG: hypothetical protein AAF351_10580 [Pseudomonadota bacterium]
MKTATKGLGLQFKLGVSVFALLVGQQAMALGTDAGTSVDNQALVSYTVGTVAQTPIDSDPAGNSTPGNGNPTTFLVDRRVSFTLVEASGDNLPVVNPGDTDVVTSFTLVNTSNAIMDFRLTVADFPGAVFGNADSGSPFANYRIRVANGDGAGGVPDLADLDYVDELDEDETVEIYVFADVPLTAQNGDFDNIELAAFAADDANAAATPGALDADLAASAGPDDPTVIDTVFGDAGNDGTEVAQDQWEVESADLVITKTAAVISSPFPGLLAVPDSVIEYTITIDNTGGAADATSVSISDVIDSDVTFVDEAYGVGQDISFDSGASFCNADAADADTDGCSLDAGTLVVGNANLAITVAGGASLTIQFQVLIPNL